MKRKLKWIKVSVVPLATALSPLLMEDQDGQRCMAVGDGLARKVILTLLGGDFTGLFEERAWYAGCPKYKVLKVLMDNTQADFESVGLVRCARRKGKG